MKFVQCSIPWDDVAWWLDRSIPLEYRAVLTVHRMAMMSKFRKGH